MGQQKKAKKKYHIHQNAVQLKTLRPNFRWNYFVSLGISKTNPSQILYDQNSIRCNERFSAKNPNQDEHTKNSTQINRHSEHSRESFISLATYIYSFSLFFLLLCFWKKKIEFPLFHRHEFVLVFPRLQRTNFGPASKMLQQINICASMKVADSLHKIFTTANLCIWDSEKKIVKFKRSQHFAVLVFDEDPVFTSFFRHFELIFESIEIVLLDFSTRVAFNTDT